MKPSARPRPKFPPSPFLVIALGAILGGFLPDPAGAEPKPDIPRPSESGPGFVVDHSVFPGKAGGAELHLYYEVPYPEIRFQKTEDGYRATFDVSAILYDRKDRQVTGDLWTYTAIETAYTATTSRDNAFRKKIILPIPPGKFRAVVRTQSSETGREGEVEFEVEAPPYDRLPIALSDLTLGLVRSEIRFWDEDFAEGEILPYPPRRYGTSLPLVPAYLEIQDRLPSDTTSSYEVRAFVYNAEEDLVQADTLRVPRAAGAGSVVLTPHATDLPLGLYRIRAEVRLAGEKSVRERWFEINEGRLSFIPDLYIVKNVLGYIANGVELTELDTLREGSLSSYWDSFWARRNPDPGASRNRVLAEFLRRYEYVNQRFSVLGPGWSTDMGKIYIKYGEPDEIERQIMPAVERWYYLARGAIFIFADADGFGRFRLVGPRRE